MQLKVYILRIMQSDFKDNQGTFEQSTVKLVYMLRVFEILEIFQKFVDPQHRKFMNDVYQTWHAWLYIYWLYVNLIRSFYGVLKTFYQHCIYFVVRSDTFILACIRRSIKTAILGFNCANQGFQTPKIYVFHCNKLAKWYIEFANFSYLLTFDLRKWRFSKFWLIYGGFRNLREI